MFLVGTAPCGREVGEEEERKKEEGEGKEKGILVKKMGEGGSNNDKKRWKKLNLGPKLLSNSGLADQAIGSWGNPVTAWLELDHGSLSSSN